MERLNRKVPIKNKRSIGSIWQKLCIKHKRNNNKR